MIGTVEHSGLLQHAAGLLSDVSGGNVHVATVVLVVFTAVTSGIMDNIPVAATMIPIVATMTQDLPAAPLWWGLVIAANLGGNGTPIGSISGVIALSALARERRRQGVVGRVVQGRCGRDGCCNSSS